MVVTSPCLLCSQIMTEPGADIHGLEQAIVDKMGDATSSQVKVVCSSLLEMGRFTLASLLEKAIDKERFLTIMEKRAAAAMLESFEADSWARTLQDFTRVKFEKVTARGARKPLDDKTEKAELKYPALCAPSSRTRDSLSP